MERFKAASRSIIGRGEAEKKKPSFDLAAVIDIDTSQLHAPGSYWMHEHGLALATKERRLLTRLVDSVVWEVAVCLCVFADVVVTIMSFGVSDEIADSDPVFAISSFLVLVLLMDVVLRVLKEGCSFFQLTKPLNWLEFTVAVAGFVMQVFEGVTRELGGDSGSAAGKSASLGRSIRPVLRVFKVFRAMNSVRLGTKRVNARWEKVVTQVVCGYLGDMLLFPKENIIVRPTQGLLHVEKAQIRSSLFEGLHLPLTVACGIIDFFHAELNFMSGMPKVTSANPDGKLLVVIENVLLVLGP